jgi:hypothetical protein
MEQFERKSIIEIEMTVKTNTVKKQTEKLDAFGVSMKTKTGSLKIAMQDASATLSIKAADDILHYNFPTDGEYIVKIFPKRLSEPQPMDRTQQTSFLENIVEEASKVMPEAELVSVHHPAPEAQPLQEQSAFAEVPEEHEESPEEPEEEAPGEEPPAEEEPVTAETAQKGA